MLCLGVAAAAPARSVEPGDSMETVRRELGPPHSYLRSEQRTVYHYDRGRVVFTNGIVAAAELKEPAAVVEERRRERQRAAARAAAERRETERRTREGLALRTRKRTDPQLQTAPPAEQVAFWRDFARRYPTVPAQAELDRALEQLARETQRREQERDQADLRALQRAVAEAQLRALQAQEATARAWERTALAQALADTERPAPPDPADFDTDPRALGEVVTFVPHPWVPPPPSPNPPPAEAPWGRYGTEQRLGPMNRQPVFGGRGAPSSAFR